MIISSVDLKGIRARVSALFSTNPPLALARWVETGEDQGIDWQIDLPDAYRFVLDILREAEAVTPANTAT